MNKLSKKAGLIIILTIVFIFDDVLIYFLLENVYDWTVNPLYFGLGATIVLGLNLSLALLVFKIMRKKPTTGQKGMIGKTGVVLQKISREGKVRIQGEIWNAESQEQIRAGEKVIVEKVEGLTLHVKRHI